VHSTFSTSLSQSGWRCLLATVLTGSFPIVSQAALIFDVGDHLDVSAANPAITLFLENSGGSALRIQAADVFFTIEASGPTVDTSGDPSLGLNLLTGPLFTAPGFFQIAGDPFEAQRQVWGLINFSGFATIDAGQTVTLGTLTFNSFPEGGPFDLSFSGTRFLDDLGDEITDFSLIDGSITVVPESSTVVAAVFVLLFAGCHEFRQRRKRTAT
jgi:hypothetical protein